MQHQLHHFLSPDLLFATTTAAQWVLFSKWTETHFSCALEFSPHQMKWGNRGNRLWSAVKTSRNSPEIQSFTDVQCLNVLVWRLRAADPRSRLNLVFVGPPAESRVLLVHTSSPGPGSDEEEEEEALIDRQQNLSLIHYLNLKTFFRTTIKYSVVLHDTSSLKNAVVEPVKLVSWSPTVQ